MKTNVSGSFDGYTFIVRVARTHNKGLKEMAGEVVNQTFVHIINSCGRLTVCASKPPLL
ncbi:MAG TPA: hypothetical protein PLS07_04865 [Niabella sp.]|nr:hypothetical protein [Niabella sp.]HQX21581.1 hypothetical protein [Niabella sp.]HQX42773.1 hypothetical protein [Niabella sp.]HRB37201.1 hypothetical protein [Niabella sp.]HRB42011.1 hypothetical protein [Niabella sp.]